MLKNINYIIAGHNGGLDEYACHIINELHKLNIPYGIFGSSMQPNYKEKNMLSVFEKTLKIQILILLEIQLVIIGQKTFSKIKF